MTLLFDLGEILLEEIWCSSLLKINKDLLYFLKVCKIKPKDYTVGKNIGKICKKTAQETKTFNSLT